MSDNNSAFSPDSYDKKIKQTLPYYDEFYEQTVELVKIIKKGAVKWLDIGCGTGKMGEQAFKSIELEKFVFCDSSDEMIRMAQGRFDCHNAEFSVSDVLNLKYSDEFDVVTSILVNHYLHIDERRAALQKCYEALKDNGVFISFENFAPFTDFGKTVYMEKWKRYQMKQGKSLEECDKHIERYGKDYYPISLTENMELMYNCGFKAVEILWLSNMQVGLWGIK